MLKDISNLIKKEMGFGNLYSKYVSSRKGYKVRKNMYTPLLHDTLLLKVKSRIDQHFLLLHEIELNKKNRMK